MRNPRSLRGSAYLYVVACVGMMGTVLVAMVPLVNQARTTETRRLQRVKQDLAEESLIQQTMAEAKIAPIIANSTRTLNVNGAAVTVTVTDGSDVVANSLKLVGSAVISGRTHNFTRFIGKGNSATPYSYAIYCANDMLQPITLVTGANGANGDVFCNGGIDIKTSGNVINGNVSAKKTVKFTGVTVTGSSIDNAADVPLPSVSGANYALNAQYSMMGSSGVSTGATFGPMVNGHYPIYYITGDVNFQGPITGKGVVYVTGNVTISGNMTYTNSSSQVAVIVAGNVTIAPTVSQIVGIVYVGGTFVSQSPDLNMTRGSIVAKFINSGPTLRATRDNFLLASSTEGTKLCLPGFWP